MAFNLNGGDLTGWFSRHEGTALYNPDGLVLNLDAGIADSYPMGGTTWYDLSGNNHNGTLSSGVDFISKFDAPKSTKILGDKRLNFTLGDWTGSTHPTTASALDALIDGMTNVTTGYHDTSIAWGDNSQTIRWGGTVSGYPSYFDRTLSGGTATNYGWRVDGWIYLPETGTTNFHLDGDDAMNVTVDGSIVAYWYGGHGFNYQSAGGTGGSITRDAGWYTFKAQFEEYSGGDGIAVGWRLPSTSGSSYTTIPVTNFASVRPRGLRNTLHFNGSDSCTVSHTSALNITGDITVECWFCIHSDPGNWMRILGKGGSSDRTYGLFYHKGSDVFLFQSYGTTNLGASYSAAGINFDQWYQLVGVRSNGLMSLYQDGDLVASGGSSGATAYSSTQNLTVGYDPIHGSVHNGLISCARVYNRALSATEVYDSYNSNRYRYTMLGAY